MFPPSQDILVYSISYHLSIGHLAFSSVVFNFMKHPHFLQVWVFLRNHSQPLHISRRYAASASGVLGDPLIKSKGVTSIQTIISHLDHISQSYKP